MKADNLSLLLVSPNNKDVHAVLDTLKKHDYKVTICNDGLDAIKLISNNSYHFIVVDENLPRLDLMTFIRSCKKNVPDSFIVALVDDYDEDRVVAGVLAGVYEYLKKPLQADKLLLALRKIELRELSLNSHIGENGAKTISGIVARSESMLAIFDTIQRVASFNTTVLVQGESGTGKELLARAIHNNSPRKRKPFIALNCGAIPENLIESELFGHKKGAFTDANRDKIGLFEEANGGTIFLDEIGEMPLSLQVKLLRVLQEQQIQAIGDEKVRKIDVRVVAATLRDLEKDVKAGRFREDLFYRLNVVSIYLPPLRERVEDIEVLAHHFIKKLNKKLGLSIRRITPEALNALQKYTWKGNVRELENCIEHAMVLSESNEVDLESLPETIQQNKSSELNLSSFIKKGNLSIKQCTEALEKELIQEALKKTKGNRTHAAKVLEISHRSLLYKLKEYGIS